MEDNYGIGKPGTLLIRSEAIHKCRRKGGICGIALTWGGGVDGIRTKVQSCAGSIKRTQCGPHDVQHA